MYAFNSYDKMEELMQDFDRTIWDKESIWDEMRRQVQSQQIDRKRLFALNCHREFALHVPIQEFIIDRYVIQSSVRVSMFCDVYIGSFSVWI